MYPAQPSAAWNTPFRSLVLVPPTQCEAQLPLSQQTKSCVDMIFTVTGTVDRKRT